MKRQKLPFFFVVTIAIIITAILFAQSRAPKTTIEKEILFPELANKINDVAHINIKSSENPDVILKKMEHGQWTVQSADNYPAQFNKIKNVVVSLSQLRILATKTDNPKLYPELGVENYKDNNAKSLLLVLSDQSGTTLASLIVGKPRKNNFVNNRPNLYVRKTGVKNALMVEGYLQLKANNNDWYERNIIHIPASRIQAVDIVKSSGAHLLVRKHTKGDTDFKVIEGDTTSPSVLLNKLGTFLEDMHIEDVHAASHFDFPDNATVTTFTTFNGMVITVKTALKKGKAFTHLSFAEAITSNGQLYKESGDRAPENRAETLNAGDESRMWNKLLNPWIYELQAFKFKALDVVVSQLQ